MFHCKKTRFGLLALIMLMSLSFTMVNASVPSSQTQQHANPIITVHGIITKDAGTSFSNVWGAKVDAFLSRTKNGITEVVKVGTDNSTDKTGSYIIFINSTNYPANEWDYVFIKVNNSIYSSQSMFYTGWDIIINYSIGVDY